MIVYVYCVLTGEAANIGGVRLRWNNSEAILLARDISVEEQGALLAELTKPDDRLIFDQRFTVVPTQRCSQDVGASAAV